ncbi:MAG TPA: periplasmic heavy metal sensor [Myxococcota bacterium]|nr:periplasmic heavy metal sensor [Myxococcota bacterium]HRY93296.1 periplasmic heavy metal sensor [Myxococcota bacterium]HSA20394.1 periplasmic heavy metal sensor [Myxococcota bacterium]
MRKLAVLVALSMLALPLAALAGPGKGGPPPAVMKKIMKDVGLSDGQIKQIEELHFKAEREKLEIRYELEKARLELQQLMIAAQPEQGAVFSQLDKIGAVQTRLKKNRVGLMLQIRKLMTPEQWQKMEAIQAEHRMQKRDKRRGLGGGGGPGGPGRGPGGGPGF